MVTRAAPVLVRLARALAAPAAVVALAAPLAASALLALARGRSPAEALDARTAWLWGAMLAAALASAAVQAARERRGASALVHAGLLLLLLQGAASAAWRFEGVADVGEGSDAPRWRIRSAGRWLRPPAVQVVGIEGADRVRLRVDGLTADLRVGERWAMRGTAVRVALVGPAPVLDLRWHGDVIEQSLVPLARGEGGSIQLGRMPHRFHLAVPEGEPAGDPSATPASLRLRVERGKLVVTERVIRKGEPVTFDGLVLRFDDGARWARLEVRRAARPLAAVLGLALLAAGVLVAARRRERPAAALRPS